MILDLCVCVSTYWLKVNLLVVFFLFDFVIVGTAFLHIEGLFGRVRDRYRCIISLVQKYDWNIWNLIQHKVIRKHRLCSQIIMNRECLGIVCKICFRVNSDRQLLNPVYLGMYQVLKKLNVTQTEDPESHVIGVRRSSRQRYGDWICRLNLC